MKFYGLDCHSTNIKMIVFNQSGDVIQKKMIHNLSEEFIRWLKTLTKEDYVALEASTNSFTLYDSISPHVKECFVLNPRKLPEIWNCHKKTDYVDAEKLCERLWLAISLNDLSPKRLPSIYIPNPSIRHLRSLFKSLEYLRNTRIGIRNKIHAFIKQAGFTIHRPDIDQKNFLTRITKKLDDCVISQISVFHQLLLEVKSKEAELKNQILSCGFEFIHEVDILTSISGITPIGALAIISDIADISRFPSPKHLCSYLRSAPGVDSSNETTRIKHINKSSRKQSLFYLLQAQPHFLKSNYRLRNFYLIKSQGKKTGTARIAVSRKTMVAIYYMLTRNEYYNYMNPVLHEKKMKSFMKRFKDVA